MPGSSHIAWSLAVLLLIASLIRYTRDLGVVLFLQKVALVAYFAYGFWEAFQEVQSW